MFSSCFSTDKCIDKIIEETIRYTLRFLCSVKYEAGQLLGHGNLCKGQTYIVLGLFMPVHFNQKPYSEIISSTKRIISAPGFGDFVTRDRLELICKFLRFANSETIKHFQGPDKHFRILPINSHLNKRSGIVFTKSEHSD
jgi:hypothetical protein